MVDTDSRFAVLGRRDEEGDAAASELLTTRLERRKRLLATTQRLRWSLLTELTGVEVFFKAPVPDSGTRDNAAFRTCGLREELRAEEVFRRSPERCQTCLRQWWIPRPDRPLWKRAFTAPCGITACVADLSDGERVLARWCMGARLTGPNARRRTGRRLESHVPDVPGRRFGQAIVLLGWGLGTVVAALKAETLAEDLAGVRRALTDVREDDRHLRLACAGRLPQAVPPPVLCVTARQEALVARMLDFVHRHYTHPFTLMSLADSLGMSSTYLSCLFSKVTGMRFHGYVDDYRMKRARLLLRDPSTRVSEVACRVGYASDHYFRQAFRKHTGLSPSAWRRGQSR